MIVGAFKIYRQNALNVRFVTTSKYYFCCLCFNTFQPLALFFYITQAVEAISTFKFFRFSIFPFYFFFFNIKFIISVKFRTVFFYFRKGPEFPPSNSRFYHDFRSFLLLIHSSFPPNSYRQCRHSQNCRCLCLCGL